MGLPASENKNLAPEKSALDERKEELLLENIKGMAKEFLACEKPWKRISIYKQEFELIEDMKKEAGEGDCPVTRSAFNEIRDHQFQ